MPSEDRDEWTEEVGAHCERCYDDKADTLKYRLIGSDVRGSGDRRVALQGRRIQSTVDRVLRARGKMIWDKAKGPADCLETEMLQCLPMKTANEVAYWFDKRLKGECRAPEAWKTSSVGLPQKPDAKLEKGPSWLPCDHTFERVL